MPYPNSDPKSCMILLHLRDSAKDLERHSHPSHKAWFTSLRLLRGIRAEESSMTTNEFYYFIDQADPRKTFFLYVQTSEEQFETIKTTCESQTSKLNQNLLPLLKEPLGPDSAQRFSPDLNIIDHREDRLENLEFIFLYYNANLRPRSSISLWFSPLFEMVMPPRSRCGMVNTRDGPMRDYHNSYWDLSNGDPVQFHCIQWNGIHFREEVFSNEDVREPMRNILKHPHYKPCMDGILASFLSDCGKVDVSQLTWEEDLQLFVACQGAERVEWLMVDGVKLTDKYFDLDGRPEGKKEKKRKVGCSIL